MLIKLLATIAFGLFAALADTQNAAPAGDRYVGDIGFIMFSDDGTKMLFDFFGKAEVCHLSADKNFALCENDRMPISIGDSTVQFVGRDFLKNGSSTR